MARDKKTTETDAPDTTERRFTTTYYRYDGNQRGSLFDPQSGEPLGRVVNGSILEVTDVEHAQRLERNGKFAKTTRAKYVEQETAAGRMTQGGEVVPAAAPEIQLDPNLNESGTFQEAADTIERHVDAFSNGAQTQLDAATTMHAAATSNGTTNQGGTE